MISKIFILYVICPMLLHLFSLWPILRILPQLGKRQLGHIFLIVFCLANSNIIPCLLLTLLLKILLFPREIWISKQTVLFLAYSSSAVILHVLLPDNPPLSPSHTYGNTEARYIQIQIQIPNTCFAPQKITYSQFR